MLLRDAVVGIGLMSGTSLDGVDVAVIQFPAGSVRSARVLAFHEVPFPPALRHRTKEAMEGGSSASLCVLNAELGALFADAVNTTLALHPTFGAPLFVASHGQTIFHAPHQHATLQMGEPAVILERINAGIQFVVSNFRAADVAAGGQGAPLVPFFDSWAWGASEKQVALINVGGIANVTLLGGGMSVLGFDTGPGNVVADSLCLQLLQQSCDVDGTVSAKGMVLPNVMAAMRALGEPFLAQQSGPRSTGRELFGAQFAREIVARFGEAEKAQDLVATAIEFTVQTLWEGIRQSGRSPQLLVVAGGGAHNPTLMRRLAEISGVVCVKQDESAGHLATPVEGLTSKNKEAVAFALLGLAALLGCPSNVPSVTGASHSVVLGQVCCRNTNLLAGDRVHAVAKEGFEHNVDAYARGRPEYPLAAVASQIDAISKRMGKKAQDLAVVDLAAGTGKLTAALVTCGVKPSAVEPAQAMRQAFSAKFPHFRVEDGTATLIPVESESLDAIFVGQAFHWFDNIASLREMHRVLRPGGLLVLIWNAEDASTPWVAQLRALYERYDAGVPQFRLGGWRRVWETAEAATLFEREPESVHRQVPRVSRQQCWDRIVSKSYVSVLDDATRQKLRAECEAVLEEVFNAERGQDGCIDYPQTTLVFPATRK